MTARDVAAALEDLLGLPAKVDALVKEVRELRAELGEIRQLIPPQLVSVREAAKRLGVTEKMVRRWLVARRLPSVRVGGRISVDLSSVRRLLEVGPV